MKLFQLCYKAYTVLPVDLLAAFGGLGLSFFGGAYCASISAIEAFKMCGWDRTKAALQDIYADACAIYDAHIWQRIWSRKLNTHESQQVHEQFGSWTPLA